MKNMKRIASLLLALCILLGMPFAVSANDASNGAPVLVRAMRIPKTAAGRLVGTTSPNYADRAFALYFNGVVTFDSNSVKVRVLGYDVKGNIVTLGEGQGTANLGADLNTNLKNSNPIVYQLPSNRSFGWMEQYDTNGAIDHFSVVIYDSSTDYEDGEIEGITLNGVTLKTTKKFFRDGGNRDAVFMTLDAAEDNLVMNSFEILDDTHMHVGFSEAVSIRLNADNSMMTPNQLSVGIYKWKSNDDYEAVKSSGSNLDGTIGSGTAYRYTVDGIEMDSDNKGFVVNFKDEAKLPRLVKALQTIRSNDPDGNYYLTFNFDEKARDAALGEVSGNYYIDAVRGLESKRPLYVNCYAKDMAHVKLDLAQASSAVRLDDSRIKLTMSSAVQLRSGVAITVNGEAVTVTAVQDTNDAENIAVAKEWLLTMPESSQALPEVSTVAVGEKAFFDAKTSSVETTVYAGFGVNSAVIDGDNQVSITFAEEIMQPTDAVSLTVGVYDKTTNQLAAAYETAWSVEEIVVDEADKNTLTAKISSVSDSWFEEISVVLKENENYELRIQLADSHGNHDGYVNGITLTDGISALRADATNGDSVQMVPALVTGDLQVKSARVVSEDTIRITFNKTIADYAGTYAEIRFMDSNLTNNQMLYYTLSGGQITAISTAAGTNRIALSFRLKLSTTDNKTFDLTIDTGNGHFKKNLDVRNMSEMFRAFEKVAELYTQTGSNKEAKFVLTIGENGEKAVKGNGLIDTIVAVDGAQMPSMNRQYADVNFTVLTKDDLMIEPEILSLKKDADGYSIKQVGKSTLVVQFNRAIELVDMDGVNKPTVQLRLMKKNGDALGVDSETGKLGSGSAPQWNATEVLVDSADPTKMVVSFGDLDLSLILKKLTMPAYIQEAGEIAFFFEENDPGNTVDGEPYVGNNHLIHHIRDAVTGKQFDIAEFTTHNGAHIIDFDIKYMDPEIDEVTIEDVEIISQSQVVVTFSEEVVIDNSTGNKMSIGYIRLVDSQYGYRRTVDGKTQKLQWQGYMNYYNDAHTQLVFTIKQTFKADIPLYGLDDIAKEMDDEFNRMVLCIDDRTNVDGVVNVIGTTTGHRLFADPFNGKNDTVYCPDLDVTQIPQGELTIEKAVAVSDMNVIITFSDPVEIEDNPYLAIRMLTAENQLLYRTPAGEYALTSDNKKNTPMQWGMRWEWHNKEHTQIKCTVTTTPGIIPSITDILMHDWNKEYAGCRIVVGFEENNSRIIEQSGYMDNIILKGSPGVALTANVFSTNRGGAFVPLTASYTAKRITASATILNDTDIRISFSEKVTITGDPHMAIRLVEEGYNLIKLGDEYNVTYLQYYGAWTWENDSHTSIIWRMSGNGACGVKDIVEVVNCRNGLSKYKNAQIFFCIEDKTTKDVITAGANGFIDNIAAADGLNHLVVNKPNTSGYDGLYMDLNIGLLKDRSDLELLSVKAVDDQTIELTFSEAVKIYDGEEAPTITISYINKAGNSETFTDGKTANFKGTVSYKDDTKTVLVWKLNSPKAKNLTEIFNFEGNLKWNRGARVAFVISDHKNYSAPARTGLLNSVTTLDGIRKLSCNIGNGMLQRDIEIGYDLPERVTDAVVKEEETVEYITNYTVHNIGGAAIAVVAVAVALCVKPKKKGEK